MLVSIINIVLFIFLILGIIEISIMIFRYILYLDKRSKILGHCSWMSWSEFLNSFHPL